MAFHHTMTIFIFLVIQCQTSHIFNEKHHLGFFIFHSCHQFLYFPLILSQFVNILVNTAIITLKTFTQYNVRKFLTA